MTKNNFLILGILMLFLGSTTLWGARQGPDLWYVTKDIELGESNLDDESNCWLCGNNGRSLMNFYRKTDDIGVIDFNTLNVYPIENKSDSTHTDSRINASGKEQCVFYISNGRRVTNMQVTFGDSKLDVENLKNNLCTKCLDKATEVFSVSGQVTEVEEPVDICLVDFKSSKLYSLQKRYLSYYVNDWYVLLQHSDKGVKVVVVDISEGGNSDE